MKESAPESGASAHFGSVFGFIAALHRFLLMRRTKTLLLPLSLEGGGSFEILCSHGQSQLLLVRFLRFFGGPDANEHGASPFAFLQSPRWTPHAQTLQPKILMLQPLWYAR